MEEILNIVKQYIEVYWKWILCGIILVILIMFIFVKPQNPKVNENELKYQDVLNDGEREEGEKEKQEEIKKEKETVELESEVFVDLKGAVKYPGVYEMPSDSRLIDVIEKAGGFTQNADSNTVNLAQVLTDQMMIYVGEIGEKLPTVNQYNSPFEGGGENSDSLSININTADLTELMELKGIGEAKAQNIVTYREDNKVFETIEEIKEVSGIGKGIFEGLKDDIVID